MRTIKLLWAATMILALYFCGENKKTDVSNGKTNASSDEMNPDKREKPMEDSMKDQNTQAMSDRVGKVYYAASTGCQAGDYSNYPHGVKSVTIECGHDGKLSKIINFFPGGLLGVTKNYNTPSIYSVVSYRADGTIERHTLFYGGVNKSQESLYSTDGIIQSTSQFYQNGNKQRVDLHRADGTLRKRQWFNTDGMVSNTNYYMADGWTGCTPATTKCVASDPD